MQSLDEVRQQQQTQQVPGFRVSAKGCIPSGDPCSVPVSVPVPACYFRQIFRFGVDFLADFVSTPPPPPPLQGFTGKSDLRKTSGARDGLPKMLWVNDLV
jgi:hypothetical protein